MSELGAPTDAGQSMEALRKENEMLRAEVQRLRSTCPQSENHDGLEQENPTQASAWPTASDFKLSTHQAERYARQIVLKSFGPKAQERLCAGSVLLVGAGGLGCPCALYLSAAGVGRIGIVDKDTVALNNLHRQIAHTEASVGIHKADSAAATCAALNSSLCFELFRDGLTPDNAVDICSKFDVVVDCSDNAPTRYLVNDACVMAAKPLVSGAAVGLDGQLTVYNHEGGPCYRCLFPECPTAGACSRCEDAGVLGVVPGVIGTLQALEAIKILAGIGSSLKGTLLIFDAVSSQFRSIKLRGRRDGCAACSSGSELETCGGPSKYDYDTFSGGQPMLEGRKPLELLSAEQRVTALQLAKEMASLTATNAPFLLLDVRPAVQFFTSRLEGAVNVPIEQVNRSFQDVLNVVQKVGHDAPKFVVCRRGNDSQLVTQKLLEHNVVNVRDLVGGMTAWSTEVDSTVPVL